MKLNKKIPRIYCLSLAILLFQFNVINSQNVEIQYLANDGIFVKTFNKKILIDALFEKEFDHLDVLPESELKKIEKAAYEFEDIDVILTTHYHGDHFNAQITGKHLKANNRTIFFGPEETVIKFKKNFDGVEEIISRIKSETLDLYKSKTVSLNDIEIKIMRLEHLGISPWKEAENFAYIIKIEGKNILHLGDSKISVENLKKLSLTHEDIDVAILPYWQLGSAEQKDIIEKYIHPKQILVAHIPVNSYSEAQEDIDGLGYTNTTVLVRQFQSVILE